MATTSADDRLLYEGRVRNRYAIVAGVAGALLLAAAIFQIAGPHTKIDELTLDLITAHKRFPLDLIGAAVEAIGWLGVAGTLTFLAGAIDARNPNAKPYVRWAAIAGPALSGITGVVYAIMIAAKAHDFVTHGSQTYQQANHLTSGGALVAVQLLGQLGALMVAVAFVLVALNTMRIGLLTRFMGYVGIFAGVLVLFVITPVPVVQVYWLVAVGYLISGRWPTGLPSSWRSGRAEPWPSSQEMREQRTKARGGRAKPATEPAEPVAAQSGRGTRATTPKRKRKRRK